MTHSCTMAGASRVWLEPLREASAQLRKAIILYGPIKAILTVCELALNYNLGNLRVKATKKQGEYIDQLAKREISIKRKRTFLAKPIGLKVLDVLLKK